MESKEFARKAIALVAFLAIAAAVFTVTPPGLRLVVALLATALPASGEPGSVERRADLISTARAIMLPEAKLLP